MHRTGGTTTYVSLLQAHPNAHVRCWQKYMKELIADRRETGIKGQDLFSGLLAASDEENGVLSDLDIMGNVFIFMIAGHEVSLFFNLQYLTFEHHCDRQQLTLCAIPSFSWLYIPTNRRNCISISRACTLLTDFRWALPSFLAAMP
jgi:hypothetical protein